MVNIGWHGDTHQTAEGEAPNDNTTATDYGPQGQITTDIKTLAEGYNCELISYGGDLAHESRESLIEPSTPPEAYEYIWQLVDESGYGDRVVAIPGNHEIPTQTFFNSDERAVRRAVYTYPDDGVTVLLLDTQANTATMAGGQFGNGTGRTNPRIRHTDVVWMERQLNNAPSDHTKVIIPHAHILPVLGDSSRSNSGPNDNFYPENTYWTITNSRDVRNRLSNYSKVVVLQSHDYEDNGNEGHFVYGPTDVRYCYKNHYYDVGGDKVSGTYGYISADSTGAKVETITPSTGAVDNTILDVTW